MKKHKTIIIFLIILLILCISGLITYFISRKPVVAEKPEENYEVLVNVVKVNSSNHTPIIKTIGKVVAAEQLNLMSEVTGKIININNNFVPGGFIKKGSVILEVDPIDYKLALTEAKSNLSKAKAAYRQALGRAVQAQNELRIYEKSTGKKLKDSDLALRKPELEQAKSNLDAAKNNLVKAQVNLDRTKIKAPFNIIVKERNVNYGSFVNVGSNLANVINTDYYWVNTSIKLKEMAFIDFANNPKVAIKTSNRKEEREASYFKLLNFLDENARFMGLLLVVKDPLILNSNELDKPKIFLDDYVNVAIQGKEITEIYKIPLFTLKNNNIVWLVKDNLLKLFKVDVVYQDDEYAYVQGLSDGDLIVTSDLSLVTNSMPVKVRNISSDNDNR